MTRHRLVCASVAAIAVGLSVPRVSAHCAPFYDSLNDENSVRANGGVIRGDCSFAPAVNGSGITMPGNCDVTYSDNLFDVAAGSVSLWFGKVQSDSQGGIMQIGTLGDANSIGLFYSGGDVYCELRNADTLATQISAPLSPAPGLPGWTHIVCMWKDRGEDTEIWLFVNGLFKGYKCLPGPFVHSAGRLQIGTTGWYEHAHGIMDELRFFDWNLLDDEVYAEYVASANRYRNQPTGKPVSAGTVQLVGKSLFVDGRSFQVRGVGYQPTPICSSPTSREVLDHMYTDPCILARDLPRLRAMNVNTIRIWVEPPDATVLDACYNGGFQPIFVIMGFWIDPGLDYGDPATIESLENGFRSYVNRFKCHPAVLAWGIGNENNLSYAGNLADWFALANRLACVAYAEEAESYHPTMVINGGMRHFGDMSLGSDDVSMKCVDAWGHNAYPGEDFHCYFDYYDRLSAKPLIVTEYGIDALDNRVGAEYQSVQADYAVRQWRQIEGACAGGTIMAYSDEWWKADRPCEHDAGGYHTRVHPDGFSNEEWYGLVRVYDKSEQCDNVVAREVYYALASEFSDVGGDYDQNGYLDLVDIAAIQRCFGAEATGMCGKAFEFVRNGRIDLLDYAVFRVCVNGPNSSPRCGG